MNRVRTPLVLLLTACCWATVVGGCAGGRGADGEIDPDSYEAVKDIHGGPHTDMMLVILTTGPKGGKGALSNDASTALFQGHMSNMQRLAEAGVLLVAGPFSTPRDASWRGLFVLDTSSVQLARLQAGTDPAVAAGVFAPVFVPVKASIELRRTGALEKAMLAEENGGPSAPAAPGAPPPSIKRYVLVSADDARSALAALRSAGLEEKILFALAVSGTPKGIIAVNADADRCAAAFAGAAGVGETVLDVWFSTSSLTGLGPPARTLPRPSR